MRGKKVLLGVEEENPWSLDSEKTNFYFILFYFWLRGIERDRREEDKKNEEQCLDSFYF